MKAKDGRNLKAKISGVRTCTTGSSAERYAIHKN